MLEQNKEGIKGRMKKEKNEEVETAVEEKVLQNTEEQNEDQSEEAAIEYELKTVIEDLESKLTDISKAKEAAEKDLLYAKADVENFKKRKHKEMQEQVKFANEKIINDLLPVMDNLNLAIEHAACGESTDNKQLNSFIEGVTMILSQFSELLKKYGVEEVKSIGKIFDPNFHEALDQIETDEYEEGMVIREYQKGYIINGRLVRPAKVTIVKNGGNN